MTKTIRIAACGVAHDYRQSLVPLIIRHLGYQIDWVTPKIADLIIFGSFFNAVVKKHRWLPKPLRAKFDALIHRQQSKNRALTLFQTGENLRHNHILCDYALSFDLAVDNPNHLRFPYWMEMIDWQSEGIVGNQNPRFGQLLSIERLMQPLGEDFLKRPQRAAIFASHLREPRATLYQVLNKVIPVDGFGPYFDASISHHSSSTISKQRILQNYAFNLCPENSMYPGYYTEKIPEAFMAGCLPITWADSNLDVDFNPKTILNLAPHMHESFSNLADLMFSPKKMHPYPDQPLMLTAPSISPLLLLIDKIMKDATR
jgi:hypothetical protein